MFYLFHHLKCLPFPHFIILGPIAPPTPPHYTHTTHTHLRLRGIQSKSWPRASPNPCTSLQCEVIILENTHTQTHTKIFKNLTIQLFQ